MGNKILFNDLANEYFNGNYDDMLKWLNENATKKHVFFISKSEVVTNGDKGWIVREYSKYDKIDQSIYVSMIGGASGRAIGLIFTNFDPLEILNVPIKIKWYSKGKLEEEE